MSRSIEEAEARIVELERLVSALRHDVRGAITPALLVADGLRNSSEPKTKRAGEKIGDSIDRVTKLLLATRDSVGPLQGGMPLGDSGSKK